MSGFEKHMADVLRNHEVAAPAGLDAQVFAALDGAGASAGRSVVGRRLGGAGLGALLLISLGWYFGTMPVEAPVVPAVAESAVPQEVVVAPAFASEAVVSESVNPASTVPAQAEDATPEPAVVLDAKPTTARQDESIASTAAQPVSVTPLEQRSVEGVEAGNAEGFDKKLLAAPEERDGVWRMKARVNVKED
jgi:hypothetical protein